MVRFRFSISKKIKQTKIASDDMIQVRNLLILLVELIYVSYIMKKLEITVKEIINSIKSKRCNGKIKRCKRCKNRRNSTV